MRRPSTHCLLALGACIATLLTIASIAAHAAGESAQIIQARVGQLGSGGEVRVSGAAIASTVVLPSFYERRGFEPAWTDPGDVDALFAAIHDSAADGLRPEDYHLAALEALYAVPRSPARDADFDLLATDALVRLGYHLRFGKVDVTRIDPHWNFRRDYEAVLLLAPTVAIQEALDQHRVRESLDVLRPGHPLYAALRGALQRYREIEAAGGWGPVPAGATLAPGMSDPRVPALRARLEAEGDLIEPDDASRDLYDGALESAVKHFQERHGLAPDGLVGGRTLRALNVPVTTRIGQLRLSLERSRLIMHDLPERFVVVNVPGYRVYYVEGGAARFASNVVVGKVIARTPIFRAEMTHVVLNPSWTVPPIVMKTDIIPGLKKDPGYLERKGLQRIGGQVVQPPGANNALGRLKLMFPNPHYVFLHDTPQRDLFERENRTFSSGCVRVEDVFGLAEAVIDDPQRWSKAKLLEAADTGATQTIKLERRVPVLLAYWTAGVASDGRVLFYEDIYARDAAELQALDAHFAFHEQAVSAARAR
jgi:murein L,D-transpeptidase YcbB/YkuD